MVFVCSNNKNQFCKNLVLSQFNFITYYYLLAIFNIGVTKFKSILN